MTELTDTQSILLSAASQRKNGSVLPLSTSIKPSGGTAKALATLLKRGFVEERVTNDASIVHRANEDTRYGVFLTAAGADAIGIEPGAPPTTDNAPVEQTNGVAPASEPAAKRQTKAGAVLALLARPDGATLPELIAATGWLPHTTRAALTGLRKKGHDIARGKRDGATCYRIADQA